MKQVKEQNTNWYATMMFINGIFFFLLHLTFVGFTNDDSFFVIVRSQWDSLWDLLVYRYETDSSRVLSEAILFTLIDMPFMVWQILDTVICIWLYHSLSVILIGEKKDKHHILLFLIVAMYPYMHVGSAGWICTSLNYMWPLATLLYVLSGAVRRYRGERVSWIQYVGYTLAMIFTANCEMSATMLFLTLAMAILFAIWEKRKCGYEVLGTIIGIAGIIFAMSAPGNDERTVMEAGNWMPEFFDLNIFEKARLCAVFVFEHFVAIPDVIFFLFSLLVAYEGIKVAQGKRDKVMALLPVCIGVIYTGCYFVKDFLIGKKTRYDFDYPAIYMTDGKIMFVQMAEVIGLIVFIIATVYTLWRIYPQLKLKLVAIWALGCGFAVRMALMLSPTMFSSWHRTLIFMYFAFMVNIYLMAKKCEKPWMKKIIYTILVIGIIVNLILTIGLQIRKGMG